MEYKCPICKQNFKISDENRLEDSKYIPFCCQRCKLVDLGAWLDGQYKVVTSSRDDDPAQDQQ